MVHELVPGLAGRVRSLNNLEGDALAVGDQRDLNLLGFPQRLWVDLATIEVVCTNINVLRSRGRKHFFASERGDLGHVYLRPGFPVLRLSRKLLEIYPHC